MEDYGVIAPLIESRVMSGPVEKHPVLGSVPYYCCRRVHGVVGTFYGTQKVGPNEVTLRPPSCSATSTIPAKWLRIPSSRCWPLAAGAGQTQVSTFSQHKLALNGDTTNAATATSTLTNRPADTLHYLAMDGIRHGFIVDATGQGIDVGGALTYATLLKLQTLMLDRTYDHHWGRPDDPNDLIYIGNPELDNDVMQLDEIVAANAVPGQWVQVGP